ncbi:hypothetical protein ACSBM8_05410 [Sphingomonas sp. ASY06-1R]|jgi:hypothetical protein
MGWHISCDWLGFHVLIGGGRIEWFEQHKVKALTDQRNSARG